MTNAKTLSIWKPPPAQTLRLIYDHQRWLNSNGRYGRRFDHEGFEFVNCDLDGVDLSGAKLSYASFRGGSMKGARFVGANLSCATIDSCDVDGADFSRANLSWATILTDHGQACFEGANLDHTAWTVEESRRNNIEFMEPLLNRTPAPPPEPHL